MCLPDSVRLLHKCCAPWLPRPIMAFFHASYECEKLGYFYVLPHSRANKLPIREARIQIQITSSSLRKHSSRRIRHQTHSNMDSRRGPSSRAPSPKPGDWRRCSVTHSELVTLQAEGYLPPAFMVLVRAGLATYKGGKQAESIPNPSKGERVCFVPYLRRGLGFPIHPFL